MSRKSEEDETNLFGSMKEDLKSYLKLFYNTIKDVLLYTILPTTLNKRCSKPYTDHEKIDAFMRFHCKKDYGLKAVSIIIIYQSINFDFEF